MNATSITYLRALDRANAENVQVDGWDTVNGKFVVYIRSKTNIYTVRFEQHILVCNCEGAANGNYCKHRAKAHEYVASGAYVRDRDAVERPESVRRNAKKGWR